MLLIDEKILIIHMKKCAGKSVCKGIIKTLPDERLRYLGYTDESEAESTLARRNGKPWKHSTAAEAIEWAGKPKSALEVILVSVRPWQDRLGSYYCYAKRRNQTYPDKYRWVADLNFLEFLRSDHIKQIERLDEFACDQNGAPLVDRLRQLRTDFGILSILDEKDGLSLFHTTASLQPEP